MTRMQSMNDYLHRALILILTISGLSAVATDSTTSTSLPEIQLKSKKFQMGVLTGFNATTANGQSLSVIEVGFFGQMALTYKLDLFVEGSQGLLTNGFSAGFTSFGLGANYNFWGEGLRENQDVKLNGVRVVSVVDYNPSRMSVSLAAKQYFFNGSQNVYPYTGLGLCGRYHWASSNAWAPFVSGCYDYLVNSPNTASSMKVLFGFDFFL